MCLHRPGTALGNTMIAHTAHLDLEVALGAAVIGMRASADAEGVRDVPPPPPPLW